MDNWERLTLKLLGLKPIKRHLIDYPNWLVKCHTDITYGTQYLVIR